jgi:hypothetical protein
MNLNTNSSSIICHLIPSSTMIEYCISFDTRHVELVSNLIPPHFTLEDGTAEQCNISTITIDHLYLDSNKFHPDELNKILRSYPDKVTELQTLFKKLVSVFHASGIRTNHSVIDIGWMCV